MLIFGKKFFKEIQENIQKHQIDTMKMWTALSCVFLAAMCSAQLPPRPLSIPGALLVPGARPAPIRRISPDFGAPKPRRPAPNALPAPLREVRPVIEDEEEEEQQAPTSNFDAEVNKLGISALTSAVRQAAEEEEEQARPSPLPFRPERPVPVTRDQIRERPAEAPPRPLASPRPIQPQAVRQELRPLPQQQPRPIRPVVRQELDDEGDQPLRQPVRKTRPQIPAQQQFRAAAPVQRAIPRPQPQLEEDDGIRRKKPTSQILRKYRTDNDDGSITWGFENDDGTFKEETLGTDCITRGKYGYFDPDGVRREYTYETGNKCDPQDEALEEEEQQPLPRVQPRKNQNIGKPQPQFRPPAGQYNN